MTGWLWISRSGLYTMARSACVYSKTTLVYIADWLLYVFEGRRFRLQHFCLRYHSRQIPPTTRSKYCTEDANIETPWGNKSLWYCGGIARITEHVFNIGIWSWLQTETYIYVATERVTPLAWPARRKSLSVETSKWGLFTIAVWKFCRSDTQLNANRV